MNVTNALQTGLVGINRGLDNAPRASGDVTGSGKPEEPEQATGRERNEAVVASAAGTAVQAAETKVVSPAAESGGPGAIIDIRV
ncbi:MAG: hypothetical protein CSA60_02840 [Neptuniibacter caesariensis]|uniref:Uncharacterized protein n=1 Tax=Neptuniibacter caesariensis TaxID=207954 RepID=A0A2G6JNC0_NEPCE|nr:MAG: hypothetical protein CSA60_02840 [Neptuniibacter caesariensis]